MNYFAAGEPVNLDEKGNLLFSNNRYLRCIFYKFKNSTKRGSGKFGAGKIGEGKFGAGNIGAGKLGARKSRC